MSKYFLKSRILWRDLAIMLVVIVVMVPVVEIASYDSVKWSTVKNVGFRFQKSGWDTFLESMKLVPSNHEVELGVYPSVRINIADKNIKSLMHNLPTSMKLWQLASIRILNKKKKVKIRLAGDSNPQNYLYERKAYKIKFRKGESVLSIRRFSLIPVSDQVAKSYTLAYLIADSMQLLAPITFPVKLYVNGKTHGVYIFQENLNEKFLRNRNLLPGEIYKGDRGRYLTKSDSSDYSLRLFQHVRNWTKLSGSNRIPAEDFGALENAITEVWLGALTERKKISKRFVSIWALDSWARYSVFEELAGHSRQVRTHNQRLLYDEQLGQIYPVLWDYEIAGDSTQPVMYPSFSTGNPVVSSLYNDQEFVVKYLETFNKIYMGLQSDPCYFEVLCESGMSTLIEEDPTAASMAQLRGFTEHERLNKEIAKLIPTSFSKRVIGRWKNAVERFLVVDRSKMLSVNRGESCLILETKQLSGIKTIDVYRENRLSKSIQIDHNQQRGPRMNGKRCKSSSIPGCLMLNYPNKVVPSRIVITDIPEKFDEIEISYFIGPTSRVTINPTSENKICMNEKMRDAEANKGKYKRYVVGPGIIDISGINIYRQPVEIVAGTQIRMMEGASFIFLGGVSAHGTRENKIFISSHPKNNLPWGVFAIFGPDSRNSTLRDLEMSGGSATAVDGVNFLGMLSIQNTENVTLDNILLRDNEMADDAIHVVYSRNILLRKVSIFDVVGDAIDVDVSTGIVFESLSVSRAGNDCIDLMTTTSVVVNGKLSNCGDKGVSAGERTTLLIEDTEITNSKLGLASKDESVTVLKGVTFANNEIDWDEYRKNLQYRYRGTVTVVETRPKEISILNDILDQMRMGSCSPILTSVGRKKEFKTNQDMPWVRPGYLGVFLNSNCEI